MAWAEIMADLNLRVNKRDAERQIGQIDTTKAGEQGGRAYGRAFAAGFYRDANGRLRDANGKFVKESALAGGDAGAGFAARFGRAAGPRLAADHDNTGRGLTAASGRHGDRAGSFFALSFGKNAKVGILKTFQGIGPGILGITAKWASAITGVAALAAAVPAAVAGAAPLALGALGGGATALLGAQVAAPATDLLKKQGQAQAAAAAATTPAQAKAAQQQLTSVQQQVSQLSPALQSIYASITRLKDLWDNFTTSFGPAFAAVLRPLPALFAQILPALRQFFQGALTMAQPLIQGIASIARTALPLLGQAFRAAAPLLQPLLAGIGAFVSGLLPGLIAMLKVAQPAVSALADVLAQLGLGLGAMFEQFAPVLSASGGVLRSLGDIIANLLPVIARIAGAFAQALGPALATFAGILTQLNPVFVLLGQLVGDFAAAVLGDLNAALGALAGLFTAIAPALTGFMGALSGVFTMLENSGVFAVLGTALEAIVAPLGQLISAILNGLAPILPPVVGFIAQLATLLAGQLGQAIAAVMPPLTVLATAILQAIAQLLPVILPILTAITGVLTAAFVGVIVALADALNAIVTAIPPSVLGPIAIGLAAVFGAFKVAAVIPGIINAISVAWRLFGLAFASNPVGLIITGLVLLGVALYEAWTRSATFRDIVIGVFNAIKGPVMAVAGWFAGPFVGFFTGAWAAIQGAFTGALGWITGTFNTIRNAIVGPFTTWWAANGEAIKRIWASIWGTLSAVFTPIWTLVVIAVRTGWALIQAVFTTASEVIRAVWNGLWQALTGAARALWGGVAGVVTAGWNIIKAIFTTSAAIITATWRLLWTVLGAVVKVLWAAVSTILKIGWDIIVGIFTVFINLLTGRWGAAWNALKGMVVQVWNAIRAYIGVVLTAIRTVIGAAWTWIQAVTIAVWNGIKAFLAALWAGIKAIIGAALGVIRAVLAGAWTAISGTVVAVWNGIKTFFTGWWGAIGGLVSRSIGWIKTTLSNAWTDIKNTAARLWGAIATAVGTAWNALKRAVATPINIAIGFLDNVLIHGVNIILSNVGIKGKGPGGGPIPGIPKIPGYAAGGRLPGYGGGDRIPGWVRGGGPVLLEAGEAIVDKRTTRNHAGDLGAWGVPGFPAPRGRERGDRGFDYYPGVPQRFATGGQIEQSMLNFMLNKRGQRYSQAQRWGQPPWDCSSLVWAAANQAGVPIPRSAAIAASEADWFRRWDSDYTYGNRMMAQTGDLLFFTGSAPGPSSLGGIGHVGMAASPSTMISALGTAYGVTTSGIGNSFVAGIRLGGAGGQNVISAALGAVGGFIVNNLGDLLAQALLPPGVANAVKSIMGIGGAFAKVNFGPHGVMSQLAKGVTGKAVTGAGDWVRNKAFGLLAKAFHIATGGGGAPGHGLVPANAKAIAGFLAAHGATFNAIAGILGNIQQESGGDPMAGTNPPGRGLIQILGDPGGTLAQELARTLAYINANGSIADINAHSPTPAAAALWFSQKYERPGNPQNQNRIAAAIASARAGFANGGPITEPILGIGQRTRALYSFGEAGREWVVPDRDLAALAGGGDGAALLHELRQLRGVLDAVPARTAAGVAKAVAGPPQLAATNARIGAR